MNKPSASAMSTRLPHSRCTSPARKSAGFSLIELMVVTVILAILASIAAPALQDMIVQSRLVNQTNELLGALQFARGEAIKRNQSIRFCSAASAGDTVCADAAGGAHKLGLGSHNWQHWVVLNTNDTVLRQGSTPASLLVKSTLDANTLTFMPSGLSNVIVGVADTITLCSPTGSGNTTRTITVRLAGGTTISQSPGC